MTKQRKERMGGDMSVTAAAITILIVFACVAAFGLLGGCAKDAPAVPFVTLAQPEIPAECSAPATAEPRLKDSDVSMADAARDRNNLKWAFRNEKNLRAACAARLKAQRGEEASAPAADAKPPAEQKTWLEAVLEKLQ